MPTISAKDQPDYECTAYQSQKARWKLVRDMKDGITAIRENASVYLPRFESETPADWAARVNMTFYNNYYAPTLSDDVGLVFASDPVLQKEVPQSMRDLLEDADGKGTKWNVFARDAFEGGLDLGHGAIWTDLPSVPPEQRANLKAFQDGKNRPYMTFLAADEIISWRTVVIGGIELVVQFVRREEATVPDGDFGEKTQCQYRVYRQEVITNAIGKPVALGRITWELWTELTTKNGRSKGYTVTDEGEMKGPKRLPLRVFYGGDRLGVLQSKPFLIALAETSVEETQVGSDYAAVMHRCNVPTPYFTGLNVGESVNMSQGINLPLNATCGYMEPAGSALTATRTRLEDIRAQLRRLGATTPASDLNAQSNMTATEAAQIARQRNARLLKAVQSFEDAWNGALEDFASFLPETKGQGGTIVMNREFAGAPADPVFIAACRDAYKEGVITREEYRYVLQYGKLPEDLDPVVTKQILDAMEDAKTAAAATADAAQRAALTAGSGDPGDESTDDPPEPLVAAA